MNDLYADSCSCCGDELPDLADDREDWDKIYEDIARQLLNGDDLSTDAIYSKTAAQLIAAMNKGLGGTSFDENDSRLALQKAFTQNLQQFSYAKTLTQFKLFKDAMFNYKGQIKSFASVKKIVADTGEVFNNKYLRTEHQFVTQSAIMAHKWETMDSEYLQYSTVGDGRVRPEHKLFDKFTALKTDPIWKRLYTPLSWNCRCTIIPGIARNVSKEYDSNWANKVVDPLVKNTIFDNNVGISKVVFTDKHPYFKANPIVLTIINRTFGKEDVKEAFNDVRKKYLGVIEAKRFGTILVNKKGLDKTQNINQGNYKNQIDALNEIKNLKKHLDNYKGEIVIKDPNAENKIKNKPNLLGYVTIKTNKKTFEVCLEKDNAIKEDFKFYYIKKMETNLGRD